MRKRALECVELMHRVRRVELFGRRQVREDAGDRDLWQTKHIFERVDELVRLEAEAIEIGVHLDVHGGDALPFACRRTKASGELARAPEHELDIRRKRVVELPRRNRPEHENRRRYPALTQRHALFDRIDAESRRKRLGRPRHGDQTVAVRVSLDDERRTAGPDEVAEQAGVMPQRAQID